MSGKRPGSHMLCSGYNNDGSDCLREHDRDGRHLDATWREWLRMWRWMRRRRAHRQG